jgi:hypothetical protein
MGNALAERDRKLVVALRQSLKEMLPSGISEYRADCVNVLITLWMVKPPGLTNAEMAAYICDFSSQVDFINPLDAINCQRILDELHRTKLVQRFGNTYFVAENVSAACDGARQQSNWGE